MRYNPLGRTGLNVSELALGTMTWGTQTDPAEAHAQIDMALDHGVTLIDTAEMYPVTPIRAETIGRTEEILGDWIVRSGRRDEIVLATKISGSGSRARNGAPIDGDQIDLALDASLRRLRTDVIDLYQLHWPNRGSYCFRQNWDYDPSGQDRDATLAHMDDVLGALQRHVEAGRIRHVGLSNESAWGTMMWLARAEATGGPRMQAIQNEYSLLYRLFDTDLSELSANEEVGLLAYSPLAAGLLTGKYAGGARPEGSRIGFSDTLGGRHTPRALEAVAAYDAIAARHGLDPVHMALAFCTSRPFMASAIFGATHLPQLERILGAVDLTLPDEVLAEIGAVHRAHPMPF